MQQFMYGTAWKEKETARLVSLALEQGFRAIDTANQRKHYHEAGVGEAIASSSVPREELFLQTKFTHVGGQDHRLPYDPGVEPGEQVAQSMASSLDHLGVDYVDSYVLHGPTYRTGWTPEDREVWQAMETLQQAGSARSLGVSNVSLEQLRELCGWATVAPRFVQNRCFASQGWDRGVRELCREKGITYQGFSLLTANPHELRHVEVVAMAERLGRTPAQIIFRFAIQIGMLPLTGTTDPQHMREDLAALEFELSSEDVRLIEAL